MTRATGRRENICPFSFLVIAPYEPEKVVIKFGNKKIVAKQGAFLNFCASRGLPIPATDRYFFNDGEVFDGEKWLQELTEQSLSRPIDEAEKILAGINEVTRLLQVEADIAKAIASMSAHA